MGAGSLRHAVVGLGLDRVHEIRKLHGVLNEEDGHIISDQVQLPSSV